MPSVPETGSGLKAMPPSSAAPRFAEVQPSLRHPPRQIASTHSELNPSHPSASPSRFSTPKEKGTANAMPQPVPILLDTCSLNPEFPPCRLRRSPNITRRQHSDLLRLHRLHRKSILRKTLLIVNTVLHRLHNCGQLQLPVL